MNIHAYRLLVSHQNVPDWSPRRDDSAGARYDQLGRVGISLAAAASIGFSVTLRSREHPYETDEEW